MRIRSLPVASLLMAILASACHRAPAVATLPVQEPSHFSLVVEHSSAGWAAKCEVGCAWTDVAMRCDECAVQLDASGIALVTAANPLADRFAFVLSNKNGGWQAQGLTGTTWQSLSWRCSASPCRARVDESGVRSL